MLRFIRNLLGKLKRKKVSTARGFSEEEKEAFQHLSSCLDKSSMLRENQKITMRRPQQYVKIDKTE